ncbi:MAG: hypothetical protein H6833_13820 [Planctomycetes bacterium]|nr:hypothetical protein [Planctomycetota bacterium]
MAIFINVFDIYAFKLTESEARTLARELTVMARGDASGVECDGVTIEWSSDGRTAGMVNVYVGDTRTAVDVGCLIDLARDVNNAQLVPDPQVVEALTALALEHARTGKFTSNAIERPTS